MIFRLKKIRLIFYLVLGWNGPNIEIVFCKKYKKKFDVLVFKSISIPQSKGNKLYFAQTIQPLFSLCKIEFLLSFGFWTGSGLFWSCEIQPIQIMKIKSNQFSAELLEAAGVGLVVE